MATIDIPLPAELTDALRPPICLDLRLPMPSAPELTLPIGGTLQGVADITRGIPTDCSMNFSLMLQLAPMMASMECLLKILKFLGDLANAGTNPGQFISAFIDGLDALKTCTGMVLPTGMFCFVKDLLALIARMLLCAVQALTSVLEILGGLQLQIAVAQRDGNAEVLAGLQCAQDNANIAAAGVMQSLQPITVLLKLADPFIKIAQVPLSVTIPGPVPTEDLDGMKSLLESIRTVAQVIKQVSDTIPC